MRDLNPLNPFKLAFMRQVFQGFACIWPQIHDAVEKNLQNPDKAIAQQHVNRKQLTLIYQITRNLSDKFVARLIVQSKGTSLRISSAGRSLLINQTPWIYFGFSHHHHGFAKPIPRPPKRGHSISAHTGCKLCPRPSPAEPCA